jgi:ADP-ribose pyrophosphatase
MAGMMSPEPKVITTSTVYHGRLFNVDLSELELGEGVHALREIIIHPGAVCMIPVTADGRLLFVTQYRHAARKRLLELPAGTLEPGEEPFAAAARELQEEVGYRPTNLEPIGGLFVAPGYTTEYIHLFVCTGLEESALPGDDDEDIEVVSMTLDEATAAIESGEICDAKSVIGILRYARR